MTVESNRIKIGKKDSCLGEQNNRQPEPKVNELSITDPFQRTGKAEIAMAAAQMT